MRSSLESIQGEHSTLNTAEKHKWCQLGGGWGPRAQGREDKCLHWFPVPGEILHLSLQSAFATS